MKIIDSKNTPEEILILLKHDEYDYEEAKGTVTASTFNKPVREIVLTERNIDKIEVEASDRLWQVLGSAVHELLEKRVNKMTLDGFVQSEERLYGEILRQRVSARFDLVKGNRMSDYKVTSAWTKVFGSRVEEWKIQESINRYLYYKTYHTLLDDKANIIVFYRDWQASKVNGKYPVKPFELIEVDLMSIEDTEKFMENKIKDIQKARDEELPLCTDKERWKGYDKKLNKEVYRKCERYCSVYNFCTQANKQLECDTLEFEAIMENK